MDGWIDGWMHGCMDAWMDGQCISGWLGLVGSDGFCCMHLVFMPWIERIERKEVVLCAGIDSYFTVCTYR